MRRTTIRSRHSALRGLALCACIGAAALAPVVSAQENSDAPAELEEVERQLEESQSRAEELEQAATELAAETEELSRQLIDTAAQIQTREAQITAAEERLEKLQFEENVVRSDMESRREALAELLAGLQRLETDPPPPLAVNPTDALGALRGAMLLSAVIPELRGQANALAQSLAHIADLRSAIEREQGEIAENLAELDVERREIATLLEQKQTLTETITVELEEERERSVGLAEQASSLNQLIERLEQARRDAELARLEAEQSRRDEQERERQERLADLSVPDVEFSEARGLLHYPAQGRRLRDYGTEDELGNEAEGLFIETRQFAQVTTPSDGWIVYAGEFRGYGELLIINAGEGYHVLLAGMTQIAVNVGQFVRAGEPVGTMGAKAAQSTIIGSDMSDGKPVLYVEFRRNGKSIDPRPWWAGNDERVRG